MIDIQWLALIGALTFIFLVVLWIAVDIKKRQIKRLKEANTELETALKDIAHQLEELKEPQAPKEEEKPANSGMVEFI